MLFVWRLRLFGSTLLFAGAPAGLSLLVGVGASGVLAVLLSLTALAAVKLVLDWPSRERWPLDW